jgi:hypothetical protein
MRDSVYPDECAGNDGTRLVGLLQLRQAARTAHYARSVAYTTAVSVQRPRGAGHWPRGGCFRRRASGVAFAGRPKRTSRERQGTWWEHRGEPAGI